MVRAARAGPTRDRGLAPFIRDMRVQGDPPRTLIDSTCYPAPEAAVPEDVQASGGRWRRFRQRR
jgi:hypothetical protein